MADARDVLVFCRVVLLVTLWDYQLAPLRSLARNVTIAGGRRSGKSQVAQIKAIYVAATNRGARVVVILPNIEAARYWLRECGDLLRPSKLRGSVVDEQAQSIRFANGSEIVVLPATHGQLRGQGRNLRLVVVEEAGFQDPAVLRDIRYSLLDLHAEGAQLWQIGSPWGGVEHPFRAAYERGVAGDEDYSSWRFRTTDNPRLSRAFIERERERIAPSEAAAEIDGEWSSAVGALFPRELLEACVVDLF